MQACWNYFLITYKFVSVIAGELTQ